VYEEQHGANKPKQQLDYAAIKGGPAPVDKPEKVASPPLVLSKTSSRVQDRASAIIDGEDNEIPVSPSAFRYKPDVPTEDLFKDDQSRVPIPVPGSRDAVLRAEQLMAGPEPGTSRTQPTSPPAAARSRAASGRSRADSHLRSISSPMPQTQISLPAPSKAEALDRPRTAPRTDSVETSGSTPQTDSTDYPWSEKEKASTAMTSAALTPAKGSKRTSSQALQQSGSESSSAPKVGVVDPDWMRVELEKHKKAQEERLQQKQDQETADEDAARVAAETTPTQVSMYALSTPLNAPMKMPTRKPVPAPPTTRSASRQEASRSGSRQEERSIGEERPRVASRQESAKEVPRADSLQDSAPAQQALPQRSSSRAGARALPERSSSRARNKARDITQQMKQYIRPGTGESSAQRTIRAVDSTPPEEPQSRARSRAGRARGRAESVTQQVVGYFRPTTAANSRAASRTASRKPSVDFGRSESRSRSIDSFRSALSDAAQSTASSTAKWRTWKPALHRRQRSNTSGADGDASRPGTSGSGAERGRATDRQPSPGQQKAKPAINLNRELPPLPGLDSWKDEEPVDATSQPHSRPAASYVSSAPKSPSKSHRSQRSRQERSATVGHQPKIGERDEIVAAIMGSPMSSSKPSMDVRGQAPPPPSEPPPPPPPIHGVQMSANFSSPSDFDYDHLTPVSNTHTPLDSRRTSSEVRKEQRRSREIQPSYPPDLEEKLKHGSMGSTVQTPSSTQSVFAGRAQAVNYSRVAGGPVNGGLGRTPSKAGHVGHGIRGAATTGHTPVNHSRNPSSSQGGVSRKMSMQDDFARMHDQQYSNLVEISASPPPMPASSSANRDRAGKGKWWQRAGAKDRKPSSNWMDQVVKSGSRSGVLLTDDVAGAPIVRY